MSEIVNEWPSGPERGIGYQSLPDNHIAAGTVRPVSSGARSGGGMGGLCAPGTRSPAFCSATAMMCAHATVQVKTPDAH